MVFWDALVALRCSPPAAALAAALQQARTAPQGAARSRSGAFSRDVLVLCKLPRCSSRKAAGWPPSDARLYGGTPGVIDSLL